MKTSKPKLSNNTFGIILCVLSCLLFWFPYKYTKRIFFFNKSSYLFLHPTLLSGFSSLIFLALLYVRGIFKLKKQKTMLLAFLVNLTLFATIFEILLSPEKETASLQVFSPAKIAFFAFSSATTLFASKEIAKIASLAIPLAVLFFRIRLVSVAMGFWGFLAFIFLVAGLYLQESINVKTLKTDCKSLFEVLH